jgi:hypothetical protein
MYINWAHFILKDTVVNTSIDTSFPMLSCLKIHIMLRVCVCVCVCVVVVVVVVLGFELRALS